MMTYYARLGDQYDHRKVCYRVVESGPSYRIICQIDYYSELDS